MIRFTLNNNLLMRMKMQNITKKFKELKVITFKEYKSY